ncbi:sigma-70 family RNA polymerase sigma factor [Streptomyces sp. BE20]|uniref:RNA polymerase sigma factor n=1 Tax=Streptomyces sp. BE20 TaxID=3002525 RepID=UPI002E760861|nr:sigma-70 family RNA polymerase sigma factor [Streptomyces sp. BE20]MEE1821078.1 sigma-70 family RNA polymerase sigma factor [Streptomyces sp. BE20]
MFDLSSPDPDGSAPPPVLRTGGGAAEELGACPEGESEDGELTERLRSGEDGVAAVLYARHHRATLAYARSFGSIADSAEDLASEAFTATLAAVRAGGGPSDNWRPYLLAVVRNTAAAWARANRRSLPSADVDLLADRNTTAPSPDQIHSSALEHDLIAAAFRALPPHWRAALQHSILEQRPTDEVARLLGLSTSGASSLVSRAREGLCRAYLTAHLQGADSPECLACTDQLTALVRHPARRKSKLLIRHLDDCARCRHRYEEMRDTNRRLRLARTALVRSTPDTEDPAALLARGSATAGPTSPSPPVDPRTAPAVTAEGTTAVTSAPPPADGDPSAAYDRPRPPPEEPRLPGRAVH